MKLTKRQIKEIQALKRLRDEDIDLSDIPPLENWDMAVVGKFYRPVKKSVTIRIDADVLAWLRGQGSGYQTRLNGLLREAMSRLGPGAIRIPRRQFAVRDRRKEDEIARPELRGNNRRRSGVNARGNGGLGPGQRKLLHRT